MATAKQLDDMTECSICAEVYTDPRSLPCVHTYCLKCIEGWSKDKQPGDHVACPLCSKEFTLPSNGVSDLPKNFFVANILKMKKLTSVESKTSGCEACSDGEATEMKVATVYCVECQQKLCQACEEEHKKFKVTRRHQTVELGNADKFREQMTIDVDKITAGFDKCREMLTKIEKENSDFIEQVAKAGMEISEKAEQLKQMIDVHKEELVSELSAMKQKRMNEIESLREEIERQLSSMESYVKYVDEVRQKGTACDIARAASDLHDRADELLKFDVIERALDDLGHSDVTFTSSDFVTDDVSKTFGQLRLLDVKPSAPTLTHVIPSQGRLGVTAVTSLGDDVFVVRLCNQQVEVYDTRTFALQRHITVPGLGECSWGLAACAHYKCLYVSDGDNASVHRAELSASSPVKKWSVAGGPRGLSVNKAHNVVVACYVAEKIQEYTTHGALVREICLQQAEVTSPWHAVQLSTGHYVVSQYTSPGLVSVVGVDGQVVRSYRPSLASDVGQMSYPTSLAVTKNDDILVADANNNRTLSMNSSLSSAQHLTLPVDDGTQVPYGLCLDESRGRLYVGDFGGRCRLLVFDCVRL